MGEIEYREVRFDEYCESCKYWDDGSEESLICDECMENWTNLHTERPVNYKEDETT